MDVVFHEDAMYYSESEFQGEYLEEIQRLEYNLVTYEEEVKLDMAEISNDSVEELDTSGQNFDISGNEHPEKQGTSEVELQSLPSNIPNQSLVEAIPESSKK
ncbi:Uncharacterized protein Adt_31303 [Abeliophyllum distichum]|uniref:Uncharacterized protein n=1 Tax=Abeliophyllum distichum TaxID=126358 RepID=A0ABD1RF08_9LAMI